MLRGQSRHTERNMSVWLDVFFVITGILIVVLAVLSFINPQGNQALFPLVFFLAAVLNGVGGFFEVKNDNRDKKQRWQGIGHMALAVFLAVFGILSGISIWG